MLSLGENGFTDFDSRSFPISSPPLIAPFWFDLDPSTGGSISYRVSNDSGLLSNFSSLWEQLNVGDLTGFVPTYVFIATWDRVPVFGTTSYFGVSTSVPKVIFCVAG